MSIPELLERLSSSDRSVLRAACDDALSGLPASPELKDVLRGALRSGPPTRRFAAAFVLFRAEPRPGLGLLPALLDALELEDGDLRWTAAQMLTTLGRLHAEVLPVLIHEARGADSARRRRMSLYVLRELAPERSETHDTFLEALAGTDPELRRAALSSIAKLHEPSRACLETVLGIARADADPRMRRIAAVLLPELARSWPELGGEITALLDELAADHDPSLSRAAGMARQRLGS